MLNTEKNGRPAKGGATELGVVVPESAKERKTEKNGPVQSLFGVPGINIGLIVAAFLLVANLVTTNASAGETEKYHGQTVVPGHPLYSKGGSCLGVDVDSVHKCELALTGSSGWLTSSNGKKIEVIWLESNTGRRDAKGDIIWRVEDSIEYPSDYKGTFETEPGGCTSSAYPEAMIIAKGKWHNRKSPKVGGFMRPIDKAWRVNFKTRKFIEISNKGVVCELNEDRD